MKKESSLSQKLKLYSALVAPTLALAASSNAQILYTDFVPDYNVVIHPAYIDLNNDGTTDFAVRYSFWESPGSCSYCGGSSSFSVYAYQSSDARIGVDNSDYALMFDQGDLINASLIWDGSYVTLWRRYGYWNEDTSVLHSLGEWFYASDKYLPIQVQIANNKYYGWIRGDGSIFKDGAINLTANQSILAGQTCLDNYEPNNSKQQSVQIQTNQEYQALINTSLDIDWFKFSVTIQQPNIRILLFNLPDNFNIFLYNISGTKIGMSKNSGTKPDTIVANGLTPGIYSVKVRGKAGHFDPNNCYSLITETSDSPWKLASPQNDTEDVQFELFPNPASQQLNIQCDYENIAAVDVSIYNMIGQQVRTLKNLPVHNSQSSITISELPQGEYLLRISFEDGVEVKKFIVSR